MVALATLSVVIHRLFKKRKPPFNLNCNPIVDIGKNYELVYSSPLSNIHN